MLYILVFFFIYLRSLLYLHECTKHLYVILFSKYSTLPPSGSANCVNYATPIFYERGIACCTTCDKVPMAKMITVNDLIIISHSYCFFLIQNGDMVNSPLSLEVMLFTD